MNAKSIVVVALVSCLGAAFVAWRAAHVARVAMQSERATLATERSRVYAESRRLEETLEAAAKERSDLQASFAGAQNGKASAPSAVPGAKRAMPADPAELLAKDPKLQILYLQSRRASFATTFGPLLQSLALTPEQIDKLRAAILAAEEQKQDITAVMREQQLPANDPAIAEMRKRARDELNAVEVEVLGAAGLDKLHDYERTLPARAIVERFAGAAALGDVPMNAQQAEQLTQLLATASGSMPDGMAIDPANIDWSTVDAKAQEILSGGQLALFKSIEPIGGGSSRWMAQFNKALMQAVKSTPPASAPGG